MNPLLERLRRALAPDYAVESEVASGGMGVVFLGRDVALARAVAIKIIRPDLATAAAAQRFLREARVLASITHPGVVTVHHAGEADGIAFYVMDWLSGETLADRLSRGPLEPSEVARHGRDLLDAAATIHALGIVHRDIKPSNVFLHGGRAMLTDFGIAKSITDGATALTAPGAAVGTPGYMPPEQHGGGDVTPAADLCAIGMVLYEAYTGRRWNFDHTADQPDWSGVPGPVVPVLARALAWAPGQRWSSATEFGAALARACGPPRRRVLAVLALALAGAAVLWAVTPSPGPRAVRPAAPLGIAIRPLTVRGDGAPRGLGDSLAAAIVAWLEGAPDLGVHRGGPEDTAAAARLGGTVELAGDSLRIAIRAAEPDGPGALIFASWRGPAAEWSSAVDSLGRALLVAIWTAFRDADIPSDALPATASGLSAWAHAEGLYARAEWGTAHTAYRTALRVDSTCALCLMRSIQIQHWELLEADTTENRQLYALRRRFPPHYRALIEAGRLPLAERLEQFQQTTLRFPDFAFARFMYGDELFHRGPLVGRRRAEGLQQMRQVTRMRPDFAPAWEHLAWMAAAEGSPDLAALARRRFKATFSARDLTSLTQLALHTAGYLWRFGPRAEAETVTAQLLSDPLIASFSGLPLGPRYLMTFDAPHGVVWMGEWYARSDLPDLLEPGLVARAVGLLASGQRDSALAAARAVPLRVPGPDAELFAAEFAAMLVAFDSLDAGAWPAARATLTRLADDDTAAPLTRARAAWMLALAGGRVGDRAAAAARPVLEAVRVAGLGAFSDLLAAELAGHLNPVRARALSVPLLDLDSAGRAGDPFFRAALHLLRAEWAVAAGLPSAARNELRWHENSDIIGVLSGLIQAADVDWAFGTIGRYRRAVVLDATAAPRDPETCAVLAGIARLWAGGDAPMRARGAWARGRLPAHGCPVAP